MFKLEYIWDRYYKRCVFICFWIIGWCNPIPFLVMLSAAHDFLKQDSPSTPTPFSNSTSNKTNKFDCNELSTGIILLADVLPGIGIKLLAPFFVHKVSYKIRLLFIMLFSMTSFLIVALSPSDMKWLTFIGVMFASASSGFGEITFLSLSTLYATNLSLGGWASGTGMSGLLGSFFYAMLTTLGLSPRYTILVMTCVPVIMCAAFFLLPPPDHMRALLIKQSSNNISVVVNDDVVVNAEVDNSKDDETKPNNEMEKLSLYGKFLLIKPLLKYMLPLFLVYFSEYFINQGLFELLYFRDGIVKDHEQQYRWYNVAFRLGVFIARSSLYFFKIRQLPIFALLQLLNVLLILLQIFFDFIPSILILFALIFWEGLLGGGCYANAMNLVSTEVPKYAREFSIALTTIADSFGIALAGLIAIPVHNAICKIDL